MHQDVLDLLDRVERRRQTVSAQLNAKHRAALGQFFTPASAAGFLAELLRLPDTGTFRLLDPGAGVGSLAAAVVARAVSERPGLAVHVCAFEVDESLVAPLTESLTDCSRVAAEHGSVVSFEVRHQSFVEYATGWLLECPEQYDACIANPPYRKVGTSAAERIAAETRGLRASNLYTIFIGLAADLLVEGGQMSVIIPRSWANGPYHEPFRRFLLDRIGVDFVHVYDKRGRVFADSDVLQENVVVHGTRGPQPEQVTLSASTGADDPCVERVVPVEEVLRPGDPHAFFRIPADERTTRIAEQMTDLPATLRDLGLAVSTGRVVDFRAKEWQRQNPEPGTVPLIYPGHLRDGGVSWPTAGSKKPNAIIGSADTAKLLVPNGTYVLVKRFTVKEERRRVAAGVLRPSDLPGGAAAVGIENHLNVFHADGAGIDEEIAVGLCAYLNCTLVDDYVRSFSGHTQINATDLRQLRYPAAEDLAALGEALAGKPWPEQADLDAVVAEHVPAVAEPVLETA